MITQPTRPPWISVRLRMPPVSLKIDRRVPLVALAVVAFTLIVLVLSVNYGAYNMTVWDVIRTLTGTLPTDHPDAHNFNLVVHTFRMPRILVAFLVGAALATAGTIMQGITRNPLAEPGILGVTAGAGLAAVTLIVTLKDVPLSVLPWAAFAGGAITALAVYALSWKRGSTAPVRLILIGVAFASVLGSLTTFILVFGEINDVQQAYVWLTGSVYGRSWDHVRTLAAWLVVLLPLALFGARSLNALNLGEEVARGMGLKVETQRRPAADQRGANGRRGRRLRHNRFRRADRAAHHASICRPCPRGTAGGERAVRRRAAGIRRPDRPLDHRAVGACLLASSRR